MDKAVKKRHRPSTAETRLAIIEAAERLFASHGIETVSLRTISDEAGQRNISSVQYHFTDRMGLLAAIFDYRETGMDIARSELLAQGRERNHLSDVRWLLRVMYYPEFCFAVDQGGESYVSLHAQYLTNLRQRGIPHPVDFNSPATVAYREAIGLLRKKLSFLSDQQFRLRMEATGAMFLGALMQFVARRDREPEHPATFFETVLEMVAVAFTVPPWDFSD